MIGSLAIHNNEFISTALGLRKADNVNGTESIGNHTRKPREQEPITFFGLMSALNKQLHRLSLSISLRLPLDNN